MASLVVQAGAALVAVALTGFGGTPGSPQTFVGPVVLALFAVPGAVVVHEAGHALACLALGSKIRAVYLGNAAPGRRRFTVGKVVVAPGLIAGGRVEHEGARSAGRNALIAAAGALADVIAAGALLAVFRPGNGLIVGLALVMAGLGWPACCRTGSAAAGPRTAPGCSPSSPAASSRRRCARVTRTAGSWCGTLLASSALSTTRSRPDGRPTQLLNPLSDDLRLVLGAINRPS